LPDDLEGETMHIHGNSFNVQAAGLSAAQELRAAETRRAADVRKKLLKSVAGLDSAADPEETLLMGRWLDAHPGQTHGSVENEDEYHSSSSSKESDFR
jgi:hypothetical protein